MQNPREMAPFIVLLFLLQASCGGDADDASGSETIADRCVDREPGTDYAPCRSDNDCYSGFCKQSCTPGPCCIMQGPGCKSHKECEERAPDFIRRGGSAHCYGTCGSAICSFTGCGFTCGGGK